MSATRQVPSTGAVLATLIGVTLRRVFRGRALWVSLLIALLPVLLAGVVSGQGESLEAVNIVQIVTMALLSAMFVASSLGEEIEDRTTTYLWSRPIARWTIVIGKLAALAPIAMVLAIGGLVLSYQVIGQPPEAAEIIAIGAGSLAVAALSAGIATLVPKHGMALAIIYYIIFDIPLAAIPASIHNLSITRHVLALAGEFGEPETTQPAIAIAVIASVWLAVALWRIRRLES